MKLRSKGRKFQEKFLGNKKEKTPEEVVKEEFIEPIQDENVETTDEEIVNKILEILSKSSKERRRKIIEELNNADEISSDILFESALQAADSDEISDAVAVAIAEELPDKETMGILKNADLQAEGRLAIIKTLNDNEKIEDAICKELKMAYGAMKNLEKQSEFVGKIQKIIGISKRTDKINEQLYKNIAKNLAFMYRDRKGAMDLYSMEQLVPIHEMIRVKMPEKIGEEYANLLEEGEENKFNLKDAKERFLERMIKEVHRKAQDEKQPDSMFMKYIGEVDEEESQALTKYVQKYNPNISKKEMEKILKIARGEKSESIYESKKIQKNMTNEKKGIDIDIIQDCINSGLITTLGKMSEEERKKTLDAINSTLERRVQKKQQNEMLKKARIVPREEIPKVKKARYGRGIDE